jgi:hypothetical protein
MFRTLRKTHRHELPHVEMAVLHGDLFVAILEVLTHSTPAVDGERREAIAYCFHGIEAACILFNLFCRNVAPKEIPAQSAAHEKTIGARKECAIHRESDWFCMHKQFTSVQWPEIKVSPQRLCIESVVISKLLESLFTLCVGKVQFPNLSRDTNRFILTQELMTALQAFVKLPASLPTILFQTKRSAFLALFLGMLNLGKSIALTLAQNLTFQPDTFSLPALKFLFPWKQLLLLLKIPILIRKLLRYFRREPIEFFSSL